MFSWLWLTHVLVILLLQALHRYSELLLLLTGRRPSELLPATPPSYIANRVLQLAQTTCVKDFNWVGVVCLNLLAQAGWCSCLHVCMLISQFNAES